MIGRRFRLAIPFVASVFLTGCVLVWGSPYHVESADRSGGAIRFDHVLISDRAVVLHASDLCSRYGKIAVVDYEKFGVVLPGGSIDEITYSCEKPTPHANTLQYAKARYVCMQQSRSNVSTATVTGSTMVGPSEISVGRSYSQQLIDPTLYRACMAARGYR